MPKSWLPVALFILIATSVIGQEVEKKEPVEEGIKGAHRLTMLIGHSNLSDGIKENNKRGWKIVPSWAIDYDFWISNQWAIGLQNDIMVETFEVEDHGNEVIERTRPISSVAAVIFKPKEHVGFILGMGGEFAKEENFVLTRLGIESGWEINNKWEFGISLAWDIKWNAYDSWVFGVGVSRLFRKHR